MSDPSKYAMEAIELLFIGYRERADKGEQYAKKFLVLKAAIIDRAIQEATTPLMKTVTRIAAQDCAQTEPNCGRCNSCLSRQALRAHEEG